ncbi:MAG: beta-hydroxyacyl-ACP dehydratase [Phycisphaerales bacterium]|nr:beta-hydroxyacyl-ACP dehydratase [Phycisphaerales bacterium]
MHFRLVDQVIECGPDRAVTLKNVSLAEEYLQDHFPGFHVLPGVFMLEALVQSARLVLEARDRARAGGVPRRMVLGGVRALKYGMFVKPGEALRSEVTIDKETEDGSVVFRGSATVVRSSSSPSAATGETAISGRFTMRPVRMLQL